MFSSRHGCSILIFISILICSGLFSWGYADYQDSPPVNDSIHISSVSVTTPVEILAPGLYSLDTGIHEINASDAIVIRSDNVILEGNGCTLKGTGTNTGPLSGILIHNPERPINNVTVFNVTVTGFSSGIVADNTDNTTIRTCKISENQGSGIVLINVTECIVQDTEISTNKPPEDSSGGTGIQVSGSHSVELQNVRVLTNGRGDGGDGICLSDSSLISIRQCTVSGNAKTGIRGDKVSSGLVITENTINSNGENGITLVSCVGPLIAGNSIQDNVMTAIDITSCQHGIISGNTAESGRVGLSLTESEDFSLGSNNFRDNSVNFDISGSSPAQYNHVIDTSNKGNGRPIRYLRDIHGMSIGPSDNPACIYAVNSSGLTISDLVLSKNGAGIFLIHSRDVSISGIASLDNAFGIRIGYGSSDVRVTSSSAENNIVAGYAVSSSDNITLSSSSAQKNLAGFLFTGSTDIFCLGCHAEKQQGLKKRGPSGFQISGCSNVVIMNSSAKKNIFDGIYLRDSPGTIVAGTTLSSNDVAGIAVLSDDISLKDNTISLNKAAGVLLYGNRSIMERNHITENSGRGLLIEATSNGSIWNNFFNNTKNVELSGIRGKTLWNVTPKPEFSCNGGNFTGGNYWGKPDGTGPSDTCIPGANGFCAEPFFIGAGQTDYHPLALHLYSILSDKSATPDNSTGSANDLNHNSRIDLQDVVLLMESISENDTRTAYDFSGDGRINLNDVVSLFSRIAN